MKINLVRIDDRLIHGQVATVWAKEANAERIIICSDEVAKDEIRKTLLLQVGPPGVKVSVVDIAKAIRVYNSPKYENDTVFFLYTCPQDVLRMVNGGVPIKSVNISGMAFKTGKTQITKAVSVDESDIDAFKKLNELGIELEIRPVATDKKVDLMSKLP
ncbi:MAG TPA: PTS fructose transporter subunit IIB [Lachnospiraceae bacterium]|nr:PTS fructose transporter subunit IIB [Lachnospiraceae bacterium]